MKFNTELYKSEYKENELLISLFCDGLPKISAEENPGLEEPLELAELHAALQGMEGGKAPGIDGLPVDFSRAFWEELGEDVLAVLNESFKEMTAVKLQESCDYSVAEKRRSAGHQELASGFSPLQGL